jgi:hypothetical protein
MGEGFHFRTGNTGGTGSASGASQTGSYTGSGDGDGGEDVYSKVVRAGKRTYFFDVKATRSGDYYLTVTESRKKTGRDGNPVFEKNKIFLYKEDFAKFADGLADAVGYVKVHKPEFFEAEAAGESALDAEFALL